MSPIFFGKLPKQGRRLFELLNQWPFLTGQSRLLSKFVNISTNEALQFFVLTLTYSLPVLLHY